MLSRELGAIIEFLHDLYISLLSLFFFILSERWQRWGVIIRWRSEHHVLISPKNGAHNELATPPSLFFGYHGSILTDLFLLDESLLFCISFCSRNIYKYLLIIFLKGIFSFWRQYLGVRCIQYAAYYMLDTVYIF